MIHRCFACDRILATQKTLVDTRDGQTVYVGNECYFKIKAAGSEGYQPPKGGPRLWLIRDKPSEPQRRARPARVA